MSDLFWLIDAQMTRITLLFPKSHDNPRVDDRRVLSGTMLIAGDGFRWLDVPTAYRPHKTLSCCRRCWRGKGISLGRWPYALPTMVKRRP